MVFDIFIHGERLSKINQQISGSQLGLRFSLSISSSNSSQGKGPRYKVSALSNDPRIGKTYKYSL